MVDSISGVSASQAAERLNKVQQQSEKRAQAQETRQSSQTQDSVEISEEAIKKYAEEVGNHLKENSEEFLGLDEDFVKQT